MTTTDDAQDQIPLLDSPSVPGYTRTGEHTYVSELRLVIECEDWDGALAFYRDALGLREIMGYKGDNEGQVILDVGRASIELVHPELPSTESGASVELSAPPVPRTRLAFRTTRAQALIERLEESGASRVEGPLLNAADTLNVRLVAPDNMPITIFRPLGESEFAEAAE
ncbi:VOC family protein [Naasia lichenicola]|uniref:VOC family protein n=1 Tax=Naasia lichenicola TaxID=2565933 RepID=A0A4S4FJF8_9MICO|nr:VOC family protein [Naasia lichenicola]THG30044.1 VOC family protein [Naasia lichenicola]